MKSPNLPKIRCIAQYLPQFHPIPENDEWWGQGFTEWTNVVNAKPLFRGHHQPNLPANLGFYDLRLPEVREQQADLAKKHGVEGFCYWHYWLGNGKRILERPFEEVLNSGAPEFPFCLAWANHDWTGHWFGNFAKVLLRQEYGGLKDYEMHFQFLLRAFSDDRYIRVQDRPLFYIYRAHDIPDARQFTDFLRKRAQSYGFADLYIVAENLRPKELLEFGIDGSVFPRHRYVGETNPRLLSRILRRIGSDRVQVYSYKEAMNYFLKEKYEPNEFPCIVPNWDSTPRLGHKGVVLNDVSPRLFQQHLEDVQRALDRHPPEQKIAFLKSWNEWAEGNYIEPDQRFGTSFLESLRQFLVSDMN